MSNNVRGKRSIAGTLAVAVIGFASVSGVSVAAKEAGASPFLAEADTNSDGLVSTDEFVLFQGEREMKRRDRNKDGQLSKEEWISPNGPECFYATSFKRFNANGDDILSVNEIVDVFTWAFGNRDANKDGFLSLTEVPKTLLRGN